MFSRHRDLFATGFLLLDGILIGASWIGAYFIRFYWTGWDAPLGIPPLDLYLWMGAVLALFTLLVLRGHRAYRSARTSRFGQELFGVAQSVTIVTGFAALASFFTRGELSRLVLLVFAGLAFLSLTVSRVLIRSALRQLRRRGMNIRHALVIGTGPAAVALIRKIREHSDYGITLHGVVAGDDAAREAAGAEIVGVPVLGAVADLPGLVEQSGAEIVYLALGRAEYRAEDEALARLEDSTATVRLVPDLARAFTLNASVEDFDGTPVVLITESPGQGWNALLKRVIDFVLAAVGLVVLSPVFLAIAIAVRLDSAGPVFYSQERVGLNGRRFRMHKFRTMRADAEASGEPGWSRPGDPRRTGIGGFLRALSLDELPQLWNVLLGQMSLVGPRPERPFYVQRFRSSVPRYMLRHHVKAGITGWAQVHGLRGDTPLDRRIEYDLYYIQNWSLLLDLRILFMTVVRVFRDASAH